MPLVPPRPRQLYVKLRQYHSRSCSASGMLHIQLLFSTIHLFFYIIYLIHLKIPTLHM
jgi:hypothetical protein